MKHTSKPSVESVSLILSGLRPTDPQDKLDESAKYLWPDGSVSITTDGSIVTVSGAGCSGATLKEGTI